MPAIRPCRIGLINYMSNTLLLISTCALMLPVSTPVNLELFLRGLNLPMTISVGEPGARNRITQKAHFPKRTTDDTESQAMARFAVIELPNATPAPSTPMILCASRRTAAVQGGADDSGHQPTAQPPRPGFPRTRHPDRGHERWLGAQRFPACGFGPENTLVLISHFARLISQRLLSRIPCVHRWADAVTRHGTCFR